MRERRYERIAQKIESVDERIQGLGGKRDTLAMLARSSQASVVEPDWSNWNEAMRNLKACDSLRKTLKTESRMAALKLFCRSMRDICVAIGVGALALEALKSRMPGIPNPAHLALGGMIVAGVVNAFATSLKTAHGSQEFLDAVSANLDKQEAFLRAERRHLMKKMYRSGSR